MVGKGSCDSQTNPRATSERHEAKDEQIQQQQKDMEAKDEQIQQQQKDMEAKDEQIQQLERELGKRKRRRSSSCNEVRIKLE